MHNVRDFGAIGDGSAADAAFASALTAAAAAGAAKRIIVPSGHYKLQDLSIAVDGILFEGDGESTLIEVGGANSNCFNVIASDVVFRGMKLKGDLSSSAAANGNGISVTAGGLAVEDLWFEEFGHGAVYGLADDPLRGPRIIRPRCRATASSGIEIMLGGAWQNILIQDADLVTEDGGIGILIYNSDADVWTDAVIRGGWCEGYRTLGVACADEAWTGADRVFGFTVDGMYFKNILKSAVKAKLSKGIRIVNCLIDQCGGDPENGDAGLYGSILANSIGQVDISNNTLRDNGDAGIVVNGNDPFPKSRPGDGFGLASIKVSGNIIEGCGRNVSTGAAYGDGIVLQGRVMSMDVCHNSVRDVTRYGLRVDGGSGGGIEYRYNVPMVRVTANDFLNSPAATHYPIYIKNAAMVDVDANTSFNFQYTAVTFDNCKDVRVGPSDSSGDSAGACPCYLVIDCASFEFAGKARNALYSAWATATAYVLNDRRVKDGNVYECTQAGTSSGGPSGDISTTEVSDGTAKWIFVHKYKLGGDGIQFSGTIGRAIIEPGATFYNLTGTETSGSMPTILVPREIAGSVTFASAATAAATLPTQADANYKIALSGNAGQTFWWSSKSTSGFTINSSNATSTATVDYRVYRA